MIKRVGIALASALLVYIALAQDPPSEQPRLATAVAPVYPMLAILSATGGEVTVEIEVGVDGAVRAADARDGHDLLRKAAEDAALRWQFDTAAVERTTQVVFGFAIMPKDTPEADLATVFRAPYRMEVRRTIPEIPPDYAQR